MVAIVDFIYHGEANICQQDLEGFLALAEEFQLKGLAGSQDVIFETVEQPVKKTTMLEKEPTEKTYNIEKKTTPKNNANEIKAINEFKEGCYDIVSAEETLAVLRKCD